MKILIFYQYFGTPKGSWSTRIYELTKRWVEKGHKVTVVTSPYEKSDIRVSKFITRRTIDGINLIIINSADSNRDAVIKRAFKALIYSLVSIWFALTEKFDVVIASSGPITVGLPALFAKWFRRKKMIFEVRDLWPSGGIEMKKITNKYIIKLALWFEKTCYKNSEFVVPCSKGMEKSIVTRFYQTPTLVIPNACDVELFSSKSSPKLPDYFKGKEIVLYAGSLGQMDNCEYLIEAMRFINKVQIHLVFIGEGSERAQLERLVKLYSLDNISFIGLIPKNEVILWLNSSIVSFVMFKNYPVLQTSSPNKLFDSFASGTPVIQNTTGWIKDLVEKEKCGINVPPDNPKELADAIVKITDDIELRNQMAKNAKRLAETEFNRDILAEKYLNKILELQN
ncbi:MAG: glycosyltransferase family 4 protein [Flavobacteriales bacterium]|nr:glycosyltransferase family 4 protein [Flavobacteriales bacterium]